MVLPSGDQLAESSVNPHGVIRRALPPPSAGVTNMACSIRRPRCRGRTREGGRRESTPAGVVEPLGVAGDACQPVAVGNADGVHAIALRIAFAASLTGECLAGWRPNRAGGEQVRVRHGESVDLSSSALDQCHPSAAVGRVQACAERELAAVWRPVRVSPWTPEQAWLATVGPHRVKLAPPPPPGTSRSNTMSSPSPKRRCCIRRQPGNRGGRSVDFLLGITLHPATLMATTNATSTPDASGRSLFRRSTRARMEGSVLGAASREFGRPHRRIDPRDQFRISISTGSHRGLRLNPPTARASLREIRGA